MTFHVDRDKMPTLLEALDDFGVVRRTHEVLGFVAQPHHDRVPAFLGLATS
jgi:hypothetical protein